MTATEVITRATLRLSAAEETDAEVLNRQIQEDLRERGGVTVVTIDLAHAETSSERLKSGTAPIDWTTLFVTLAASGGMLTTLINVIQSRLTRERSVTLEIDGDKLLVAGMQSEEQQRLINDWLQRHQRPNYLPLPIVLFFNLLIMLGPTLLGFQIIPGLSPCVSPIARALSQALIILLIFHLFWRNFNKEIKKISGALQIGVVLVNPIQGLAALVDQLHPWVSNRVLWAFVISLGVPAVIVAFDLSPFSPFRVPEATPVIQSFSVRYPDGTTPMQLPGGQIEIANGKQVIVEAILLQPVGTLCEWSAIKGTLPPAADCSTLYSGPLAGNVDTLTVHVQSECKTQNVYASLRFKVIQDPTQP